MFVKKAVMTSLLALAASGCTTSAQKMEPQTTLVAPAADVLKDMNRWAAETGFNGVIALRHPGQSATITAFGQADHLTGRALTTDSVFQTGSVGKLFTAVAAFRMAEEGVIDLDVPISMYLPDYRSDNGDKVTLAQLMSNRSGITDKKLRPVMGQIIGGLMNDPDANIADMPGLPKTIDETIAGYFSEDLLFEPGTQFDYANSNWIILPRILEKASGKSFDNILQDYVFAPAKMKNSGSFVVDLNSMKKKSPDIAIGHNPDSKQFPGDYPLPAFIGGGTYTSAADMLKFMDALYGGKLINSGSLKRLSTVTTAEENYAYGGRIITDADNPSVRYSWQSGSNGATKMVSIYNLKTGYNFTALSNRGQEQGDMFDLALELEK